MKPVAVKIMSPADELKGLNDEVTEKLEKWDIFDIDVRLPRLKRFFQVIEARNLVHHDPDIEFDDTALEGMGNLSITKRTIVVGKLGSDFKQHEKDR